MVPARTPTVHWCFYGEGRGWPTSTGRPTNDNPTETSLKTNVLSGNMCRPTLVTYRTREPKTVTDVPWFLENIAHAVGANNENPTKVRHVTGTCESRSSSPDIRVVLVFPFWPRGLRCFVFSHVECQQKKAQSAFSLRFFPMPTPVDKKKNSRQQKPSLRVQSASTFGRSQVASRSEAVVRATRDQRAAVTMPSPETWREAAAAQKADVAVADARAPQPAGTPTPR